MKTFIFLFILLPVVMLGQVTTVSDPMAVSGLPAAINAKVAETNTALALKATLASPHLTGVPTAPTASVGTNTTQIATMAAIQSAIANLTFGRTIEWVPNCKYPAAVDGTNYAQTLYPVPACDVNSNGIVSGFMPFVNNGEHVQGSFTMPGSFTTLTAEVLWSTGDSSTSVNFVAALKLVCVDDGDALDANLTGASATTSTTTNAGANKRNSSAFTLTTAAASCAGKTLYWDMARVSSTITSVPTGSSTAGPMIRRILFQVQ